MPGFKNIRPELKGSIYYLMFVITYQDGVRTFRLCQCPQADRLSEFLPSDLIIQDRNGVVTFDPRITHVKGNELCRLFWELLHQPEKSPSAETPSWAKRTGEF